MGYLEEFDLSTNTTNDLHKKVARAIDKGARDVVNESPATEYHAQRLRWANKMRETPDKLLPEAHRGILWVLDNSTIAAAGNAATDGDVQTAVNGLINNFAGV
jgi:hypothetical protein